MVDCPATCVSQEKDGSSDSYYPYRTCAKSCTAISARGAPRATERSSDENINNHYDSNALQLLSLADPSRSPL